MAHARRTIDDRYERILRETAELMGRYPALHPASETDDRLSELDALVCALRTLRSLTVSAGLPKSAPALRREGTARQPDRVFEFGPTISRVHSLNDELRKLEDREAAESLGGRLADLNNLIQEVCLLRDVLLVAQRRVVGRPIGA